MKKGIKQILKNFYDIIKKPEMQILPGQIAFYFLMSLIPILALASIIVPTIISSFDLMSVIKNNVPSVFADIIIGLVNGASSSTSFFLLIVFYLILGSNGPQSIIIASDTLYGIALPNAIKIRIKSFIMIFIMIVLLIFMIFVPVLGNLIMEGLAHFSGLTKELREFAMLITILKALFTFLVIYLFVKLLYTLAPDTRIKSSETTMGSLFTTFSWMFLTEIFAFYIVNMANYNELYGNFANILILLMWIYFLAYLFVIGMAINIQRYKKEEETST